MTELALAYARRKRFEAKIMMVEMSKAWGGEERGTRDEGRGKVPASMFLRKMGVTPPKKGVG